MSQRRQRFFLIRLLEWFLQQNEARGGGKEEKGEKGKKWGGGRVAEGVGKERRRGVPAS